MKERVQKIISRCGFASRRAAEKLIISGRVLVNGEPAKIGDVADVYDEIFIDGVKIPNNPPKIYIMLNKPSGVVTTLSDEKGRRNVCDVVQIKDRIYPVGRLDLNSEGLLIMTNDGDLTNRLTHPSHNISKRYIVDVKGEIGNISSLSNRIYIDGYLIREPIVDILHIGNNFAKVSITIFEGRNRQIRKMCAHWGLIVLKLVRVQIGEILLSDDLHPGCYRALFNDEIEYLLTL